jgi:hypothetical protein
MEKQRRRELKAEGKRLVAEGSVRIRQQLFERNPFPIGDPNWVRNLQAEYKINRKYRKNSTEVLLETKALEDAEIKYLGFDFENGFIPHSGWYVLCKNCRNLVPSKCAYTLGCSCGAVIVLPETKQVKLPKTEHYAVVELIGHGPVSEPKSKRPWWQLW